MFNPLKITEMLTQANQMQEEVQRKLAQTVVEGSSGGGAVTATMNGKKQLLKLHIDAVGGRLAWAATSRMSKCSKTWSSPPSTKPEARPMRPSNPACKGLLGGLNLPGLG